MRDAILIDTGVLISDVFYLLVAYFSAEQISDLLKDYGFVKYIGAGIIIAFGIFTIIKKQGPQKGQNIDIKKLKKPSVIGLISKGMALNAVNIGVLAYWIGVCAYIKNKHIEGVNVVIFFAVTLLTLFGIDLIKMHFASKLKKKLTPKTMQNISVLVGLILIFVGIALMFNDIELPPNEPNLPMKTAPLGS